MAPFDSQFYLIMNLAVGGATDYWSDHFTYGNRKPWRTDSPQVFKLFKLTIYTLLQLNLRISGNSDVEKALT